MTKPVVVKRKTVNSNSDAPALKIWKNISSEGNRKDDALASGSPNRLIPMMDYEAFKDF